MRGAYSHREKSLLPGFYGRLEWERFILRGKLVCDDRRQIRDKAGVVL
jgi:hypothetical protein